MRKTWGNDRGGEWGRVGHRWKKIASRNGDLDEPLLQHDAFTVSDGATFSLEFKVKRNYIAAWVSSPRGRESWLFHVFFLCATARENTSFITHVLRYFLLISSFVSLRLRSTLRKSPVQIKNRGPSLIVKLVIELLQFFSLRRWWVQSGGTQMWLKCWMYKYFWILRMQMWRRIFRR